VIGQVQLDQSTEALEGAARDWGLVVHDIPLGVITPTSVFEVVEAVVYAKENQIPIVAQGSSHSVMGQAQALDGIVLDMKYMNSTLSIAQWPQASAWVEAGSTWRSLLAQTLVLGLTPPVFTDYVDLSIGGTLSVGGKGTATIYHGLQVDNVLALEVVTGRGEVEICSPSENSELFYAVLAGYGQFGVITKARIALIPAQPRTLFIRTLYTDYNAFMEDMFFLVNDGRYDGVQGAVAVNAGFGLIEAVGNSFPGVQLPYGSEPWLYIIEGVYYFTPGNEPDISVLTGDLNHDHSVAVFAADMTYTGFVSRLDSVEGFLRSIGQWDTVPHAWIDVFLAREIAVDFIEAELADLDPSDVNGPILIKPYLKSAILTPNYPFPDSEEVFSYALLRAVLDTTPGVLESIIQANHDIYDRAVALGGTGYAIDSFELNPENWERHLGTTRYSELACLKQYYDPEFILTPNQHFYDPNSFDGSCPSRSSSSPSSPSSSSSSSSEDED